METDRHAHTIYERKKHIIRENHKLQIVSLVRQEMKLRDPIYYCIDKWYLLFSFLLPHGCRLVRLLPAWAIRLTQDFFLWAPCYPSATKACSGFMGDMYVFWLVSWSESLGRFCMCTLPFWSLSCLFWQIGSTPRRNIDALRYPLEWIPKRGVLYT